MNEFVVWQELVGTAALVLLSLIALLGIVIPGVPGTGLILIGVLIHKWLIPGALSWWTVAIVAIGVLVAWAVNWLGAAVTTHLAGGTRWGMLGAIVGTVLGLLFLPVGLIVGPLLGAFVAELCLAGKRWQEALRSGLGASVGFLASTFIQLLIAGGLLIWIVIDLLTN